MSFNVTRQNTDHLSFEVSDHVVYAICSQSFKKLNVTALAQAIREHWAIEVRRKIMQAAAFRRDTSTFEETSVNAQELVTKKV
jgi:predicted transposase YbfD/YdcC